MAPEEKNPFPGRADRDINVEPVWTGGNPVNDINVAVVDKGMKHLHAATLENVAAERNHDYNGANQIVHPLNTHGTVVAGIIAAMGNAVGVRGAAPVPKSTATTCSARPPAPRATRWTQ